jgi:hypothetical protein
MSIADDVKASLDKLFTTVITDDLALARPAADSYLTNVVTVLSNPTTQNTALAIGTLATSSMAFEEQFVATLGPQMGAVAAKDAAASVKALIDLESDNLTNQLAGSTSTTAAVAVAASSSASAGSAAGLQSAAT